MTLVQLKHFITLARLGSFAKASVALFLTQPALSRSIKALEEELGQLLFDRVGRRIELTAFGQRTLERALALLEDADQLARGDRSMSAQDTGRLRIGLSSGPGALLTVPLMTHFANRFPQFHLDILRANTEVLTQMLRDRQADAVVVDLRSLRPAPDLAVSEVHELEGAFLCRPGHPLLKVSRLTPARLWRYPLASTPLSDELARILVERYGASAHPLRMIKLTTDEVSHLVEVALRSDTVVLAVRAACPALKPLRIQPALQAQARFGLVTLVQRSEPAHLAQVRSVLAEVFARRT
ncbi:MAG: LysR family transcriptional regulator [Limnohabitans sp.]|jgi:DNA-binding transcriptional LysR family regulator|nr:LysR family transcriptional regulator [Limnohabitans sp.]